MIQFFPKKFLKILPVLWLIIVTNVGNAQTEIITTPGPGTFIVPNGITTVAVEAWGGGGGSGGHGSTATAGGTGSTTSILTITANGGSGSAGATSRNATAGGTGGTSIGGATNTSGASGTIGSTATTNNSTGGNGGSSPFGGLTAVGANPTGNGVSISGILGNIPGGGAGGSARSAAGGVNSANRRSTGGGGGGGYSTIEVTSLIPGNEITFDIGAGGTAGTGSQAAGGAGGNGGVEFNWACTNTLTSASGTDNQSLCINVPITTITYELKGGRNTPVIIGLPSGVSFIFEPSTGLLTISGTPTVPGIFIYSITQFDPCPIVITGAIRIESTTWNGTTWSNGDPTATKAVTFTGDYSSATSLEACSILVTNNADVSFSAGSDVTLQGAIIVDTGSTFTLDSDANLIQETNVVNAGFITVKRNTSGEVKRLDYNLWSSPVAGQNLLAFSPETLTNRFYVYNPTSDLYSSVPPATTDFAAGKGYLIRMPNTFSADTPSSWEGTFTGVPNNGTYTINVGSDTFNAIGNPYPSTVDLDAFLAANPTDGTVYFWRKTNNASSTSYATYTTIGGVANSGGGSAIQPNGTLQVGQGFIVKSTGTNFNFTNAMRIADHGNQFLRTAAESEITTESASQKSRLWLNLTSNVGVAGQLLVGYVPGATAGIDLSIDGRYINDSPNAFTSIINGEEFTIQGRSLPFTSDDAVLLGFKTTLTGMYTISLNHVDGLFTDETLPIYIKDNLTGVEHNLRTGAYEFSTGPGVFNARFELRYQSILSVTNPITAGSILIYRQNQVLQVKVSNETLTAVTVYDLTGRVLAELNNLSTTETSVALGKLSNQVLLVRLQTQSGDLVRKVLW